MYVYVLSVRKVQKHTNNYKNKRNIKYIKEVNGKGVNNKITKHGNLSSSLNEYPYFNLEILIRNIQLETGPLNIVRNHYFHFSSMFDPSNAEPAFI